MVFDQIICFVILLGNPRGGGLERWAIHLINKKNSILSNILKCFLKMVQLAGGGGIVIYATTWQSVDTLLAL